MKKYFFITVFDGLITSFLIFLSFFAVCNCITYYKTAMILSVLLAVIFFTVFCKLYYNKLKKQNAVLKDKKTFDDFIYTMPRLSSCDKRKYCLLIAKNNYPNAEFKDGCFYDSLNDTYIYYNFTVKELTVDDALNFIDGKKQKVVIFSVAVSQETLKYFSSDENVKFIYGNELFNLFKIANLLPPLESKTSKLSFKGFVEKLLQKENGKKLLFFGIFFTLFSFITPFKIYYAVCGLTLILLSLCSKFLKQKQ